MAIFRSSGKRKNGIVKLKIAAEKLQRSLLLGKKQALFKDNEEDGDSASVPDDVKEGHFAVVAVDGDQPKRFVVHLSFLTNPTFLRLLEQAAEEYGFDHEGALTIPCRPCELERKDGLVLGSIGVSVNPWSDSSMAKIFGGEDDYYHSFMELERILRFSAISAQARPRRKPSLLEMILWVPSREMESCRRRIR